VIGLGLPTQRKKERPGPDGPNASGWYRRLREPISPFSVFNSVQLKQLFSHGWTILLSSVIYNVESGITNKYSNIQVSFWSLQVSFRFHFQRCSEILVSPNICTKIHRPRTVLASVLKHRTINNFNFFRELTNQAESSTRYRPQFYKVNLLPSPHVGKITTGSNYMHLRECTL